MSHKKVDGFKRTHVLNTKADVVGAKEEAGDAKKNGVRFVRCSVDELMGWSVGGLVCWSVGPLVGPLVRWWWVRWSVSLLVGSSEFMLSRATRTVLC